MEYYSPQLLEQNGGYGNNAQPRTSVTSVSQSSKPAGQLNNLYNAGMFKKRCHFSVKTIAYLLRGEKKSFGGFSYFVLVLGIWHLYHCVWPCFFFFFLQGFILC